MTTLAQRSFTGGEIAPALYARVDTVKYATGLRILRNFFIPRQGGASSRPGTQYIAEAKDSTKNIRLIPFVFNASQTYVLEFGDQYMRVYKNGVQGTNTTQFITNITQANPAVVTAAAHGFSNGQEVTIAGVSGMTQVNGRNFKVASVTTNTFALQYMDGTNVNSTGFGAYVATSGVAASVYEIATPFAYTDLSGIQLVQSADVITLAHPSYAPMELDRIADLNWVLSTITFAPSLSPPTALSGSLGAGTVQAWVVTSVNEQNGDESLPSANFIGPTGNTLLSWTAASGVTSYNIYKFLGGIYGYIGSSGGGLTTFADNGAIPDVSVTPPISRNPFSGSGNYPATVGYFQQRLLFGNTNNAPETVYTSRSGRFKNFTLSFPSHSDDAITFALVGRQVNAIQHVVDLGKLVILTSGGELAALGDANGVLTPTGVNTKQYTSHGSSSLAPIIIGSNILYNQARGSIVRSLTYSFQIDGYTGDDLTIFSAHLFDGFTLVDWAYQQIPNSILWAVRSDGTLLGLTYIQEQQMLAWHRHDFDGVVENVCSVPEGNEDALYLVIRRTINGETKRYIERMYTRQVKNIIDYGGVDAALKYDGRNTSATTMTLTGGTGLWDDTQTLTLTASNVPGGFIFKSTDVGKQIFLDLLDSSGNVSSRIRFTITGYTSTYVVTGNSNRNVDSGLQSAATLNWSEAITNVSGIWHLEGKKVSVFADGFVVANPSNKSIPTLTVTNGTITLDKPYAVITVGLPITCDIQTLDIDSASGETMADKKKQVGKVTCLLQASRGLWAGAVPPDNDSVDPLQDLEELKIRQYENYDQPVSLVTDTVDINNQPQWNSNGRVFLRQIDPLPLTVLSIDPAGMIPVGRG